VFILVILGDKILRTLRLVLNTSFGINKLKVQ